jgi:hypothetical protein
VPGAALADPAQLLDVEVDELARTLALVAVSGSGGSSRDSLPSPIRLSQPDTVESAIERHSAISADVIRSRRSASLAATRSAANRAGLLRGAELRSNRPSSPCERHRASHWRPSCR